MSLAFSEVSILLSRLEDIELQRPPIINSREKQARLREIVESWFKSHRRSINDSSSQGSVALLSTLLPERRTDRVYGIQPPRLCKILSRVFNFGVARTRDLHQYTQRGCGDLATCLERVLKAGGPPAIPVVSVQEVDDMLQFLASCSRFSDPAIPRLPQGCLQERDQLIGNIFKRLQPAEAKWLVRIILKDFSPVRLDETLVLKSFHFLLPTLIRFQNDFDAAVALLKGSLQEYPVCPDSRSERLHFQRVALALKPVVGIKVGRPEFFKARSIENCMEMFEGQKCVMERKYDGEYCEIHVDLTISRSVAECIKIFSKSGKDSTLDRKGLHQTLVDCLQLGKPGCRFKKQAIFLGEIVVYSGQEKDFMQFDEIRKHVTRSGIFLGTGKDALPSVNEHLAIVFFDLLLLDDDVVLRKSVEERRRCLRQAYLKIPGRAMGAEWKMLDFGNYHDGKKRLVEHFAASIARRYEGLVLKICGVPYFPLAASSSCTTNNYVKLKKDYIAGLGDEADFAVIGASYNAQQGLRTSFKSLRWTSFHLGCLRNKGEVLRFNARPCFKVVGSIHHESCIPPPILQTANHLGQLSASPFDTAKVPVNFDVKMSTGTTMGVCFDQPLVFEILGSGFEKPPNASFFMLRHPRVKKLHMDRTWRDCISFDELQSQASTAQYAPLNSELHETRAWVDKLELKHAKRLERARMVTPRSSSNATLADENQGSPGLILEGITLIGQDPSSSAKRSCQEIDEAPQSVAKKLKISGAEKIRNSAARNTLNEYSAGFGPTVLSDITNFALNFASSAAESYEVQQDVGHTAGNLAKLGAATHQPRSGENRDPIASITNVDSSVTEELVKCEGTICLFANAVVHLAPCISTTPYISDDLITAHNSLTVAKLAFWDSDTFAHPPLVHIISKDRSHPGMRKIVLVERNRRQMTAQFVQRILGLVQSRQRVEIEVFDWRVLEECRNHDLDQEKLKHHLLGVAVFDKGQRGAHFVPEVNWLAA